MSRLRRALTPTAATRYKFRQAYKSARSGTLVVGGLGFLCSAAYYWETIAGLCATGVSLLLLEICSREDGK